MKKQLLKMITLLAYSSVLLSSCSLEYRQQHRTHDEGRDHNHDRNNDRYNNNH